MAQAGSETHVSLLATVVLLLDDEAEQIAAQLLRLCLTLDPLTRSRLRLLRVREACHGGVLQVLRLHGGADMQRAQQ